MTYYGAKELAASFRTVRGNTLKIAEEIPEDKYSFSPAPGSRTVAQTLVHIANLPKMQESVHSQGLTTLAGFDFMGFMGGMAAEEKKARTKAEIIELLKTSGESYAAFLEGLSEEKLGEVVTMPPGGAPPSRTRFDMVMSVKEHEMHHRGQLMLVERLIGITPHITRAMQERMAAMQAQPAVKA